MSNFNKVGTFMKTFGQEVKNKASLSTDKINKLRVDLIKEELDELTEAMNNKDLLEVADALTDILYVTYGAGHAFGIDLDKCFDEVQNSNMSKLDENGKPIYNDSGKVIVTREDVRRHNALDKLIRYTHRKKLIDNHSQFIACSGRLNFELIQKGLMSNIGIMAGVGAPTSLAIDLAKRFEMTLLGFVKNNSFNIYTNKERIIL